MSLCACILANLLPVLLLISPLVSTTPAPVVTVVLLDGSERIGELTGLSADSVRLVSAEEAFEIALADVAEVSFDGCLPAGGGPANARFYLAGEGALGGELIDGGSDVIVARTDFAPRLVLPLAALSAIRLGADDDPDAARLFAAARAAPLAGNDVLIALDDDGAKALRGRLSALNPEEGAFEFGDRPRRFRTTKAYGIVMATGAADARAARIAVALDSGEVLPADNIELRDGRLHLPDLFGQTVEIQLERVCALRLRSARVVQLSTLRAEREVCRGIVHPTWPIVRDGNVRREPLGLGGKTYATGIGVHAYAEIEYSLGGRYETFAAVIGIDDAARPGGNVVFRVLGDGQPLLDSGPVTGADAPQRVSVSVSGVDKLTLIVDPGDNADVGDWADWADARLILPRAPM